MSNGPTLVWSVQLEKCNMNTRRIPSSTKFDFEFEHLPDLDLLGEATHRVDTALRRRRRMVADQVET